MTLHIIPKYLAFGASSLVFLFSPTAAPASNTDVAYLEKTNVAVLRGTLEPSEFPLADKFAVSHLRAAVLDEYQVESSSLGKGRNFLVFCVALQLRNPLLALRLQLLLLRALLQVLELDDVAVRNVAVVRAFREQEEIAVAGTWWGRTP